MIQISDGIVTLQLNGKPYQGTYYFRCDMLVTTTDGMKEGEADLTILNGDLGKPETNLAKLVLINMVRESIDPALSSRPSQCGYRVRSPAMDGASANSQRRLDDPLPEHPAPVKQIHAGASQSSQRS